MQANQFLTVMQIGDANTIGAKASVQRFSEKDWIGVFLGEERVVVFSRSKALLQNFAYQVAGSKKVTHLITELPLNKPWLVAKSGKTVATGSTGKNGTISFADNPGGVARYVVKVGK